METAPALDRAGAVYAARGAEFGGAHKCRDVGTCSRFYRVACFVYADGSVGAPSGARLHAAASWSVLADDVSVSMIDCFENLCPHRSF
jgi:hypothetical protein